MMAPDLELASLSLQFQDISNNPDSVKSKNLNDIIVNSSKTEESRELLLVPHTQQMWCISANNLLKTKHRSTISIQTENKYIYIRMNMPVLSEWNPTAAAKIFVEEKSRRTREISTGSESLRRQSYFKGVFAEADLCAVDEESGNLSDLKYFTSLPPNIPPSKLIISIIGSLPTKEDP